LYKLRGEVPDQAFEHIDLVLGYLEVPGKLFTGFFGIFLVKCPKVKGFLYNVFMLITKRYIAL